jgi:hypothetical protein
MLAGGRSPWPLAALVGAGLLGRAVLGPNRALNARRAALVFWGGFTLGASVLFLLLNDAYRTMMGTWAHYFANSIPSVLRNVAACILAYPVAGALLFAPGAVIEVTLQPVREAAAARLSGRAGRLLKWTALGLAALVVLSLVGSLFLAYPQFDRDPPRPLTASERVSAVLATMATMFRLREPNFLLSSTFWVGFGWLDTMPGSAFQTLLLLLVAGAVVALLLHIAQNREVRRFAWLVTLALGATASLALYTLSTQHVPKALQGRYLIGWYLAILAVVGTSLALIGHANAGEPAPPAGASRAAFLLLVAGSIHTYCLSFILRRYF